jgi:hypothetical protein
VVIGTGKQHGITVKWWLMMKTALLLSLVMTALMSGPAMAQDYVFLRAKHSDKCAQVDDASLADGANISQYDCVNQDNVKWRWTDTGNGYLLLQAKHSGKCAQVDDASNANGANISQYSCVNQDNVKWTFKLVESTNGAKYYNIVNKASGKCLQVDNASRANGANISQYDCVDQDNVKWKISSAAPVTTDTGNLSNDVEGWNQHGFAVEAHSSRSLSDLIFTWKCRPPSRYEAFNVHVRISDGREGQAEVEGGDGGSYRERNAAVGQTYFLMVQGCNKGTFSSNCTEWSQLRCTANRSTHRWSCE